MTPDRPAWLGSPPILEIRMQSRLEPGAFGLCYECADGLHERCIGVPCACPCPVPERGERALTGRVAACLEGEEPHDS